jgi:hypothetical protein
MEIYLEILICIERRVIFSWNNPDTIEFVVITSGNAAGPPYLIWFGRYGGNTTGSCALSGINMPLIAIIILYWCEMEFLPKNISKWKFNCYWKCFK